MQGNIRFSSALLTAIVLLALVLPSRSTFAQEQPDQEENLPLKSYLPFAMTDVSSTSDQQVVEESETTASIEADAPSIETETLASQSESTETIEAAAVSAATLTLYPTDDTYATSVDPSATRGDRTFIHVNGSTTYNKFGFLKFTLNSVPAGSYISKATLRLYAQTTARLGVGAFQVFNDTWAETSLTWSNQPTRESAQLAAVNATTAGRYAQFTVTAAVTSGRLHSSQVTFRIERLSTTNLDIVFATKEATVGKPELVITYAPCVQGQKNASTLVPHCGAWLGGWRERPNTSWKLDIEQHESMIGRPLDVIRNFHPPGQGYQALTSEEKAWILAKRTLLIGYRPAAQWKDAAGGNPAMNQEITNFANSVKSVAPNKVMLILFHEPERYVIGCGGIPGTAGTAAEYVQMWQNVRKIFKNVGSTNVIWVWNVQNIDKFRGANTPVQCHMNQLWPGNSNVDWVMWNPYVGSATTQIVPVIQEGYNWLVQNSNPTQNYLSKPWGLGEWGIGVNDYWPTAEKQAADYRAFGDALHATANPFPKLKLLAVFDERESTILADAEGAYREFANRLYLKQLR